MNGNTATENEFDAGRWFPLQVHSMLNDLDIEDVVSWQPHGCAFKVHSKAEFERIVLPM
jgi:hypothetical protein